VKVLRISPGFDPVRGGPSVSTVLSCLAAAQAGIETVVVTTREPRAADATARLTAGDVCVLSFPLIRRPTRPASRWSISISLSNWLFRHAREFDVLHTHGAWTQITVAALLAGKVARKPVILTPNESLTDFDLAKKKGVAFLWKLLLREWYKRECDAIVFASELERDASHGSRRCAAVIPHAVELPHPRQKNRSNPARLRIGFIGRFDPKKNLDVLIQALPLDAQLHIAGDGKSEFRSAAVSLAQRHGVADQIIWHGFVHGETKESFFSEIDVLVMPSKFEAFGVAAAEAMARALPVIVSRATGLAPLVMRHDCGIVVEASVEEIRRALADPNLMQKGGAARTAVATELNFKAHGMRLGELYALVAR
jgi:glycosyltransferase involved in cell wall biosynthesis